MEGERNVPDEISCQEQIFDVAMHKSSNTLAAGLINGIVEVWRHTGNDGGENTQLMTLKVTNTHSLLVVTSIPVYIYIHLYLHVPSCISVLPCPNSLMKRQYEVCK